jgi:hypothetical protein
MKCLGPVKVYSRLLTGALRPRSPQHRTHVRLWQVVGPVVIGSDTTESRQCSEEDHRTLIKTSPPAREPEAT